MWFSPGMFLAGVFVYIVYAMTGSASQWWLWLVAVCLFLFIDALLGVGSVEIEKTKTTQRYVKKK